MEAAKVPSKNVATVESLRFSGGGKSLLYCAPFPVPFLAYIIGREEGPSSTSSGYYALKTRQSLKPYMYQKIEENKSKVFIIEFVYAYHYNLLIYVYNLIIYEFIYIYIYSSEFKKHSYNAV